MSQTNEQISVQEETQVLDALDVWLKKEVANQVRHFDHEDEYPHEIVAQMKDMGLFSLMYPVKYGGLGFSASSCLLYTSPSPRDKRQSRMPSSA